VIFDILTRPAPELSAEERAEVKKVARTAAGPAQATAGAQLAAEVHGAVAVEAGDRGHARHRPAPRLHAGACTSRKCSAVFEHVYESYVERVKMKSIRMATSMGLALVTVLVAGIEVQAETPAGFVPIKAVRASSERAPDAPPESVPVSIAPESSVIPSTVRTERTGSSHVLWDDHPASGWDNGYPVGNGRLGAIPLGSYPDERILINEETIWHRNSSPDRVTPENSFEHLEEVRDSKPPANSARQEAYFQKHLCGRHPADAYQFFGWININYEAAPIVSRLSRARSGNRHCPAYRYTLEDGTVIQQEVFASAPDDVVAVQITADRDIEFSVSIDGSTACDGELVLKGRPVAPMQQNSSDAYAPAPIARLREPRTPCISDLPARRAFILLSQPTTISRMFKQKRTDDWQSDALTQINAIAAKSCDAIRQDAIADHAQYFSRLSVSFGTTDESIRQLTTAERLNRIRGDGSTGEWHADPELVETYLQYGRYMLIASSRPDSSSPPTCKGYGIRT
jgi:hypothetical protein